jgi:hypothetical protein
VPDIVFGKDGKATFPTKYHGEVTLSKVKWDTICSEPERFYYRFNGEKIATTLINPDSIRHHRYEQNQFFYYKKFLNINLNGIVEMGSFWGVYFAVVIDVNTARICTVYPVEQPKPGKAFKPSEK